MSPFIDIVLGVLGFLLATVVFDLLHALLHRCIAAQRPWLRRIGALHQTHHEFLNRELRNHHELAAANIRRHVIPEFVTQITFTSLLLLVLPLRAVCVAWLIELLVFLLILRVRGYDVNHCERTQLQAYRPLYFCVPEYHYLHHIFPDAYFSSWIKTLDHLLKKGISLRGRRAIIYGFGDDRGSQLGNLLETSGARVERPAKGHSSGDDAVRFDGVEVLVIRLEDFSNSVDLVHPVQAFLSAQPANRAPREIWCASDSSEGFEDQLSVAKALYQSPDVIYRHILLPSKDSMRRIQDGLLRGFNVISGDLSFSTLRRRLHFVCSVRSNAVLGNAG